MFFFHEEKKHNVFNFILFRFSTKIQCIISWQSKSELLKKNARFKENTTTIVGRGLHIAYPILSRILSHSTPCSLFVALFVWLNMPSYHICLSVIVFNDIIDMNLWRLHLDTLVPATPCCVFYATRHQIRWRFDTVDMVFASNLIWQHTYIQTNTHRTHKD